MFGPKQDPYHTRPDDAGAEEPTYPQDAADQEQQRKKRNLAWKVADVALDVVGEVIEGILDNI